MPSETIVVPAVDVKEEPEPNLAVPSGKKVSGKKTPKTVTKKLAPEKARKAVRKPPGRRRQNAARFHTNVFSVCGTQARRWRQLLAPLVASKRMLTIRCAASG